MKIVWTPEVEEILRIGHSLFDMGNFNWALTRNQALEAAEKLLRLGVPILGGDVYEEIEGKIRHNYDNWHCNQKIDESIGTFVTRSVFETKKYISNYQKNSDTNYYFTITPDD